MRSGQQQRLQADSVRMCAFIKTLSKLKEDHCRVLSRGKNPVGEETSVEVEESHTGSSGKARKSCQSHSCHSPLPRTGHMDTYLEGGWQRRKIRWITWTIPPSLRQSKTSLK